MESEMTDYQIIKPDGLPMTSEEFHERMKPVPTFSERWAAFFRWYWLKLQEPK
jgi:hypothetical protein